MICRNTSDGRLGLSKRRITFLVVVCGVAAMNAVCREAEIRDRWR